MSHMDALSVSERLKADKTLSTLFDILRSYGDAPSAFWLKGEEELSLSYAEMTRRADDYASCLSSLVPETGHLFAGADTAADHGRHLFRVIGRAGGRILF